MTAAHNGRSADADNFLDALDPAGSYVVIACAGSGKTWLLASRMLRLLVAGAAPGSILALTFTRKAAGEMRDRLTRWCRELALMDDDQKVVQFLIERGLREPQARASVGAARGLLDQLLDAQPGIAIDTFHGWFLGLIKLAPLAAPGSGDSGAHAALTENTGALREEAWQQFAAHIGADAQSAGAQAFEHLVAELGLYNAKQGLMNLLARRAEWWAYAGERDDAVADADAELRELLGVREGSEPIASMVASERAAMREFLPLLMQNNVKPDADLAPVLERLLDQEAVDQAWFDAIQQVWLTTKGAPRATRKAGDALRKRLGAQMERFLALHERLAKAMQATAAALTAARACAINASALRVGALLIGEYQSLKAARGLIDFTDAEWRAAQQLTDPDHAAYLHARLDARYRHVLLDEFQDTNPLQWAALRGWFDAYGDDGARPSVLLVGDPKQLIYRFRRADARLFDAAAAWLTANWQAQTRTQNKTRRNAPAVVDAVNAVFGNIGLAHFAPQDTWCTGLPGRVECLPLIEDQSAALLSPGVPRDDLRDPLTEARPEQRDERDLNQGRQLAARLRQLAGRALLHDDAVAGGRRVARWSDVLILARRKSVFTGVEAALRESGIPYVTARGGGLLDTPEARDLIALIEFLINPANDLALAHALKSPVFGASDEDLICIARRENSGKHWWERLCTMPTESVTQPVEPSLSISPTLARAHLLAQRWIRLAGTLPVHDLIDRVFDEGDVVARTLAAAPPHLRAAVQANLEALIELALNLDAGRFPSLPRFINELAGARRGPVEEAPDEGVADAGDAVRLMTVHGAKGLEASIVCLVDAHSGAGKSSGLAPLIDWPAGADTPTHFSFLVSDSEAGAGRASLLREEREAAELEEKNLLYVAMTRAKQILIVSGAHKRGAGEDSAYARVLAAVSPADDPFQPAAARPDATPSATTGAAETADMGAANSAINSAINIADAAATNRFAPAVAPPTGVRRAAPTALMRRGVLVHALLQQLAGARDAAQPPADAATLAAKMPCTEAEVDTLLPQVAALLAAPALARFFDPARFIRARNEIDIVSRGELMQIDRLVEFDTEVWVLDYKAQVLDSERAAYCTQIDTYAAAVLPLFPGKAIKAGLIDLARCVLINA